VAELAPVALMLAAVGRPDALDSRRATSPESAGADAEDTVSAIWIL
jgi:hypothetical protein